jgi:hypothetical protein
MSILTTNETINEIIMHQTPAIDDCRWIPWLGNQCQLDSFKSREDLVALLGW